MGDMILEYLRNNGSDLLILLQQHLQISLFSLILAVIIGIPCGILCWKFRGARFLLTFFQILRVVPSLAILLLFIPLMGTGVVPASLALVLLAVPAILMNTTTGLSQTDPATIETGYGLGMTDVQLFWKVNLPLAVPLILVGVKTAAVEIIASATLAAKIGAGGLGELIFTGLGLNRMDLVIIGGLSVAFISLAVSLFFDLLERVLVRYRRPLKKEGRTMKPMKGIATALLAIALAVTLPACSGAGAGSGDDGSKGTVRVGSKDFTESVVVSEIYALALEDAGFTVERVPAVASSVIHTSIISDEIDMYPEYTGTGLLSILEMDMITDPDEVYRTVKDEYDKRFDITWLDYSQANDGQGLVIRTSVAQQYGIETISDLQKHASEINFASQGEFDQREDGIPALVATYGPFDWKSSKIYDNGLKYSVLSSGDGDVSPAYTTEGQLTKTDEYTLLIDDKKVWPPYNLAPIIRNEVLGAHPEIADVLNKVSATLTTENVTALNAAVDVDKRESDEVAREYFDSIRKN